MAELVPIRVEDAIVLNVSKHCNNTKTDCRNCSDVGVAVHNWLISTELRYVIIDLQDEKDICPAFIQEIIQLRKRLRIPFLFCGVMERPMRVLEDYNYTATVYPTFLTPEEAVAYMSEHHPIALSVDVSRIRLNEVLQVSRPRASSRLGDDEDSSEDDLEEAD